MTVTDYAVQQFGSQINLGLNTIATSLSAIGAGVGSMGTGLLTMATAAKTYAEAYAKMVDYQIECDKADRRRVQRDKPAAFDKCEHGVFKAASIKCEECVEPLTLETTETDTPR